MKIKLTLAELNESKTGFNKNRGQQIIAQVNPREAIHFRSQSRDVRSEHNNILFQVN